MANKHRGEVAITLPIAGREKQFALRPTFAFIAKVEAECDCGLWELAHRFADGDWRVTDLVSVVSAGLAHDRSLAPRDIRDAVFEAGPIRLLPAAIALCGNAAAGGDASRELEGNDERDAGPVAAI